MTGPIENANVGGFLIGFIAAIVLGTLFLVAWNVKLTQQIHKNLEGTYILRECQP